MKTPPVADAADGVLQSSVRKSERLKVGRRHLAAPVDLQLEAEALTLVQALQPGPLDSRDMDECIGLAVIALNEAETLHRVEELHRALDALASGLALMAPATTRRAAAITVAEASCRALLAGQRFALDLPFDGRHADVSRAQGNINRDRPRVR